MSGYEVYPATLRGATTMVSSAATILQAFAEREVHGLHLAENALGMIPEIVGSVDKYNNALDEITRQTQEAVTRINELATALDKAADFYETQDEEDFRRLKKIGDDIN